MPGEVHSTGAASEPAGHRPTAEVLRVLFERAPEIITLTDNEGRQLLVNPAARRLLGIPAPTDVPYDAWSHLHRTTFSRFSSCVSTSIHSLSP